MDTMVISGLRCTAHIGCKEEERALPQALLVTVTLALDTREAAESDDLSMTVNYSRLSKAVIAACEASRCQLIETLAANLSRLCLDFDARIAEATVEVRKPAGLPNGDYAAIIVTRKRETH